MSNNLYMAFHPSDYLTDTAHLSTLEHGAYLLLIMNYWQRGEPLPADDRKLRGIARLTPAEWQDARETLLEFFTERDGLIHHKRIDEELERARAKSSKARASAEQSHSGRKANAKRTQSESLAHQDQDQEQTQKEDANASSSSDDDAEKVNWDRVEATLIEKTGWRIPGFATIEPLIEEGYSLNDRIIPLAVELAESRRRTGQGPPENWAYLAATVRDATRQPKLASRPAKVPLVGVLIDTPEGKLAVERYKAETGKPPVCVDGKSWFPAHMVAPPAHVVAA